MRSPRRKPRAGRRETAAAVRSWAGYHLKTWNHGCGHRLLLPFITTQNIAGSGNYRTIRQNFWLTLFSPHSGHENGGVGKPRGSHTVPASQLCYYSTVPRALTRGEPRLLSCGFGGATEHSSLQPSSHRPRGARSATPPGTLATPEQ